MADTKNIIMHTFNGTDYDTLYPKTTVEQVNGAIAAPANAEVGNILQYDGFE